MLSNVRGVMNAISAPPECFDLSQNATARVAKCDGKGRKMRRQGSQNATIKNDLNNKLKL